MEMLLFWVAKYLNSILRNANRIAVCTGGPKAKLISQSPFEELARLPSRLKCPLRRKLIAPRNSVACSRSCTRWRPPAAGGARLRLHRTYACSRDANARTRPHVRARTHAIATDGHTAAMHTLSIRVFARYVNSLPDVDRGAQGTQLRVARLWRTEKRRIAEEFHLSIVRKAALARTELNDTSYCNRTINGPRTEERYSRSGIDYSKSYCSCFNNMNFLVTKLCRNV